MAWNKVTEAGPPVGRPVLVRTKEGDGAVEAFLTQEGVWYSGGAMVQNSMTLLAATPTEWCEPDEVDCL